MRRGSSSHNSADSAASSRPHSHRLASQPNSQPNSSRPHSDRFGQGNHHRIPPLLPSPEPSQRSLHSASPETSTLLSPRSPLDANHAFLRAPPPLKAPRPSTSRKGGLEEEDEGPSLKYVSTYSLVEEEPVASVVPRYGPPTNRHYILEKRYNSVRDLFYDFCARTSSHGIPHIGESATYAGKLFWATVFVCCFIVFLYQTHFTVARYLKYGTIVEMELKFEAAPFPAVTICNLNPYKHSRVVNIASIKQTLAQFNAAIEGSRKIERAKSPPTSPRPQPFPSPTAPGPQTPSRESPGERSKRQVLYRPILVQCKCREPRDKCVPVRDPEETTPSEPEVSVCMCFEDKLSGNIWPCYPTSEWTEELCGACSISNSCPYPLDRRNRTGALRTPCLCQSVSNYCMVKPDGPVEWWDPEVTVHPFTTPAEPPSPPPEVVQALGMETVKDTGSITTKTKENIILIVAALPGAERESLSYDLDEFVFSCTFNMGDCNLDRDFKLQLDPVFGNCFTFNYNDSVTLKNSRAGPMYGLRLLLNVNQTDYLPSTEAAGVRLVVHEQEDEPFPDTFGYSAPVGAISSFGLKTKQVSRLGPPYGKCKADFRPEGYIYDEYYSTEGCYRNCFQQQVILRCGCGDPRFPLPAGVAACAALDPAQRGCLRNETAALGGYYRVKKDCVCYQPCSEDIFETAYSASAWPANNYKTGECPPHILINDTEACSEYFRQNTVFIEIYYEQLNFESLRETEAYSMVNLMSDFGGNIGLWIGFSAITAIEFIELFLEFFYLCWFRKQRARQQQRNTNYEMHFVNQVARSEAVPVVEGGGRLSPARALAKPKIRSPPDVQL